MKLLENYPRARGYIYFLIGFDVFLWSLFVVFKLVYPVPFLRNNLLIFSIGFAIGCLYKYEDYRGKNEDNEIKSRPRYTNDIGERAWKYFMNADKILHDRVNYFLVAESMLLVAFFTGQKPEFFLRMLPLIGITITLTWYYSNRRTRIRMKYLRDVAEKNNAEIFYYVRYIRISPSEDFMITTVIPYSILTLWFFLFTYSMGINLYDILERWLPLFFSLLISFYFIIEEVIKQNKKVFDNIKREYFYNDYNDIS